ncbi:MAG TPA: hypothetical protein EYP03_05710, partial [Aquificae bacterium]|nr:hypothetical protein [Aquificota bacterium]
MKAYGFYKERLGYKQIPVFCDLKINLDKGKAIIKNLKPLTISATLNLGDVLELVFFHDNPKAVLLEILT